MNNAPLTPLQELKILLRSLAKKSAVTTARTVMDPNKGSELVQRYQELKQLQDRNRNPLLYDSEEKVAEAEPKFNEAGYRIHYYTTIGDMRIAVENRKGSYRRGKDPDGKEWATKMENPYGEILGTRGVDDDPVDVFIGPHRKSEFVLVVHTSKRGTAEYDEDKVIMGCLNRKQALSIFKKHYTDWELHYLHDTPMTLQELKEKLRRTKDKPRKLDKNASTRWSREIQNRLRANDVEGAYRIADAAKELELKPRQVLELPAGADAHPRIFAGHIPSSPESMNVSKVSPFFGEDASAAGEFLKEKASIDRIADGVVAETHQRGTMPRRDVVQKQELFSRKWVDTNKTRVGMGAGEIQELVPYMPDYHTVAKVEDALPTRHPLSDIRDANVGQGRNMEPKLLDARHDALRPRIRFIDPAVQPNTAGAKKMIGQMHGQNLAGNIQPFSAATHELNPSFLRSLAPVAKELLMTAVPILGVTGALVLLDRFTNGQEEPEMAKAASCPSNKELHQLVEDMNLDWDNNKAFMGWCGDKVGTRHLSDMTSEQRYELKDHLKSGNYPKTLKKEGASDIDSALQGLLERRPDLREELGSMLNQDTGPFGAPPTTRSELSDLLESLGLSEPQRAHALGMEMPNRSPKTNDLEEPSPFPHPDNISKSANPSPSQASTMALQDMISDLSLSQGMNPQSMRFMQFAGNTIGETDMDRMSEGELQDLYDVLATKQAHVKVAKDHQTLAVDFDHTLWDTGNNKPVDGAKDAMERFRDAGWKLIIFSVRGNTEHIKDKLEAHDIPFDHINHNPDQPEGASGKVIATHYIDDRAVPFKGNWEQTADKVLDGIKHWKKEASIEPEKPPSVATIDQDDGCFDM